MDFLVQVFIEPNGIERLSIIRASHDGSGWVAGISWDDLQRLKSECGRGGKDAVEIFPCDCDVVNVANMRHIWVNAGPAPNGLAQSMTDPLSPHSDNLREFFFSATPDKVALDTIELRHPLLDDPVRFVNDPNDLAATLEDDAPVDASAEVTFFKGAFTFIPPESSGPGMPTCTIECMNVSSSLQATLAQCISFAAPVQVTYRVFLSDDLSEPDFVMHGLTLKSVSAGILRVRAEAGFDDFLGLPSPRRIYDSASFPGLVR